MTKRLEIKSLVITTTHLWPSLAKDGVSTLQNGIRKGYLFVSFGFFLLFI